MRTTLPTATVQPCATVIAIPTRNGFNRNESDINRFGTFTIIRSREVGKRSAHKKCVPGRPRNDARSRTLQGVHDRVLMNEIVVACFSVGRSVGCPSRYYCCYKAQAEKITANCAVPTDLNLLANFRRKQDFYFYRLDGLRPTPGSVRRVRGCGEPSVSHESTREETVQPSSSCVACAFWSSRSYSVLSDALRPSSSIVHRTFPCTQSVSGRLMDC